VPPPLFVVGPPRSGTTLTARILGRHSRIFMPGETHFFDDIYSRRRELGELRNSESIQRVITRLRTLYERYNEQLDQKRIEKLLANRDILEKLRSCGSYEEIFSCFMGVQMQLTGKVRWGNNVPKDIFHFKDIFSFYPNAKFIVCIRDVRDFLISYQNKWQATAVDSVDRIRKLYHPILTSLVWKASARQFVQLKGSMPSTAFKLVRYEDLVENPQKVVRDICDFIGEEFQEDMLNVDAENSSFREGQVGIFSSSVGRWRRLLSNEEAYIAQQITARELAEFGYSPVVPKINPLKVAYICATLPLSSWRALHANRALRGPLFPYVARRVAALWQTPSP
jgi:Sulfotransferase family